MQRYSWFYRGLEAHNHADVASNFRAAAAVFLLVPLGCVVFAVNALRSGHGISLDGSGDVVGLNVLCLTATWLFYVLARGIDAWQRWARRTATILLWSFLAAICLPFILVLSREDRMLAYVGGFLYACFCLIPAYLAIRMLFILNRDTWPFAAMATIFPEVEPPPRPLLPSRWVKAGKGARGPDVQTDNQESKK